MKHTLNRFRFKMANVKCFGCGCARCPNRNVPPDVFQAEILRQRWEGLAEGITENWRQRVWRAFYPILEVVLYKERLSKALKESGLAKK